ncbi:DUF4350 domain-containing protein [Terrimonas alba]|uniref:DUF4350 domain-containing protein n=1 Tax=Terrimonas alba TaxID=3349636 RepID=UPI0035F45C94
MKKFLPHILIGLVVLAILFLLFTGNSGTVQRFDDRVTFRKRDKIPYGTFVAYESLKHIFPTASVITNKQEPGYWDSLSMYDERQALVIVTPFFNADESEMKKLVSFMESGNDVFVSTMKASYEVTQMLKCDINAADGLIYYFDHSEGSDLLSVSLSKPPFPSHPAYTYPGKRYDFYFYKVDSTTATVLGNDKNNKPNFIHLKAGKGNLYMHLAPTAFTNYFLLHKNNITYYEQALSVISPATEKIVWDEYYINKRQGREKKPNWLSVFLQHKELRWALLTGLIALLVYVLLEMRRKQRYIPVVKTPVNDSLEFVKTIGRMYHDKGDHKNLCKKMAAYFLEHIRSRYKLNTSELDDEFVKTLHAKTGVGESDINSIVQFIRGLDHTVLVSDKELASFHKQLESFYKKA